MGGGLHGLQDHCLSALAALTAARQRLWARAADMYLQSPGGWTSGIRVPEWLASCERSLPAP